MNTTIIQADAIPVCPYCKHENDALSGNGAPRDGDIAVCLYCLGPAIIETEPSISLRKPKPGTEQKNVDEIMEDLRLLPVKD